MNFIRKLLFPLSWIYGIITILRNFLFEKGWFISKSYTTPIICVGNLTVGGTGKSPMIELLLEFLKNEYKVAVLSRGYKRKTRGYKEVQIDSTSEEVGDEPLQFKNNFPNVNIAVCADRQEGIRHLETKSDVILLDDAFQHRKVKASTYILLTTFNDLYVNDYFLPTGNLRESKKEAKRADVVIVTKCPEGVSYAKLQEIQFLLKLKPNQRIYFSKIGYEKHIFNVSESLPLQYLKNKFFTLVTGIAKPKPLVDYLKRNELDFEYIKFSDHHQFTNLELKELNKKEIILTTEKDYVRLQPKLDKYAIYYLPIKTIILKEQESFFKEYIIEEIEKFGT